MRKEDLKSIMANAWFYYKKELFDTFGEALKASWNVYFLKEKMKRGMVEFTFVKVSDGSYRKAMGTLKSSLIDYEFKGGKKVVPDVVSFWDMMKGGWRSFRVEKLVA